jgi:DNA invertase Pin-like site-specific DNA recombinase
MQEKPNVVATDDVVIFGAKSSPDPHESIPGQIEDCEAFAKTEGLHVVGTYSDENASAYSADRGAGLAAALTHAKRLQCSLLVWHSDRLARGDGKQARHLVELFFECRRAGVTLRSVQDDHTFDDVAYIAMMGQRAHEDSRRKGLGSKKGLAKRRADGGYIGRPLYGYVLGPDADDPDPRALILHPEPAEAAVVNRMASELLAGQTQAAIARAANDDHIPTKRGTGRWHQSTVRRLLRNPAIAGLIRGADGALIEATHPSIVEREKWDQIQVLLNTGSRRESRGRPAPHLLQRGFLRCGECGRAMVPRSEGDRYRCHGRAQDGTSCSMPPIPRRDVDEVIFAYFAEATLDLDATRERLREAVSQRVTRARSMLDSAECAAQRAEEALARVRGDYKRGALPVDDWLTFKAELESELAGAVAERDRLAEQLAEAEAGTKISDAEQEVLERLAAIRAAIAGRVAATDGVDAVRATLLGLFDSFVLHRGIPTEAHVELIGNERWIEPVPSQHAIEGYDEHLHPLLARKPLEQAANNYALATV